MRSIAGVTPLVIGALKGVFGLQTALLIITPLYAVGGCIMLFAARTYPADLAFVAAESQRLRDQDPRRPVRPQPDVAVRRSANMPAVTDRPTILATAPLRGPGLDILRSLGDVIEDSWISESTMRLYNAEQLAARIAETGATIVICEADKCAGPVLEAGLVAIASTRGDPTNVDIAGATAAGIPVLARAGTQRRRAWPR